MAGRRINIALLTSSRADFSIYLPLLHAFQKQNRFNVNVIAFGTHLSKKHGYTVRDIKSSGIKVAHTVPFVLKGDKPEDISRNMGDVIEQFTGLWKKIEVKTDLIICLGDRYEMFAAVLASIPFRIPIAHIHGGEETLGSIDNVFRHALTEMSQIHFTSAAPHAARVKQLVPGNQHIYNVGALGIDSMKTTKRLSKEEFFEKFRIVLDNPVLATLHPETAGNVTNKKLGKEFTAAIQQISRNAQVIVTLPNADAEGGLLRKIILNDLGNIKTVNIVENLGVQGYYTALYHCKLVIGNSSSGIIEAATYKKWVINIGNRQQGRTRSGNVIDVAANQQQIIRQYKKLNSLAGFRSKNVYGNGNTSKGIVRGLLAYFS